MGSHRPPPQAWCRFLDNDESIPNRVLQSRVRLARLLIAAKGEVGLPGFVITRNRLASPYTQVEAHKRRNNIQTGKSYYVRR